MGMVVSFDFYMFYPPHTWHGSTYGVQLGGGGYNLGLGWLQLFFGGYIFGPVGTISASGYIFLFVFRSHVYPVAIGTLTTDNFTGSADRQVGYRVRSEPLHISLVR